MTRLILIIGFQLAGFCLRGRGRSVQLAHDLGRRPGKHCRLGQLGRRLFTHVGVVHIDSFGGGPHDEPRARTRAG